MEFFSELMHACVRASVRALLFLILGRSSESCRRRCRLKYILLLLTLSLSFSENKSIGISDAKTSSCVSSAAVE